MTWRPMTEHVFPWKHHHLVVAAFDKAYPADMDVMRVTVGEHGALFPVCGSPLSLIESGWIPFAWRIDDVPERTDAWPPMWDDYLTEEKK